MIEIRARIYRKQNQMHTPDELNGRPSFGRRFQLMEVGIDIFLYFFFRNGEQSRQPHAVLDVHQAMLQIVQVSASMTEEGNAGINAAELFCQKVPGAEMMKHNIYIRHLKQTLLPEHLTGISL